MSAFDIAAKMVGRRRLERKIASLTEAFVRRIGRQGISEATKPLVPKIRAVMPVGPKRWVMPSNPDDDWRIVPQKYKGGNLKRSIGRRFRSYRKSGVSLVVVGPRWPQGAHAHWIEWGTAERMHKGGHRTGRMTARNLMARVWDENEEVTLAIAIREIRLGLLAEARRV